MQLLLPVREVRIRSEGLHIPQGRHSPQLRHNECGRKISWVVTCGDVSLRESRRWPAAHLHLAKIAQHAPRARPTPSASNNTSTALTNMFDLITPEMCAGIGTNKPRRARLATASASNQGPAQQAMRLRVCRHSAHSCTHTRAARPGAPNIAVPFLWQPKQRYDGQKIAGAHERSLEPMRPPYVIGSRDRMEPPARGDARANFTGDHGAARAIEMMNARCQRPQVRRQDVGWKNRHGVSTSTHVREALRRWQEHVKCWCTSEDLKVRRDRTCCSRPPVRQAPEAQMERRHVGKKQNILACRFRNGCHLWQTCCAARTSKMLEEHRASSGAPPHRPRARGPSAPMIAPSLYRSHTDRAPLGCRSGATWARPSNDARASLGSCCAARASLEGPQCKGRLAIR